MTTRTALWLTLALGAMGLGCGSPAADFCDAKCECQNCSEKKYDECIVEEEASFDKADVYGCQPENDAVYDCAIRKFRCTGNEFTVNLADCMSQNNDRDRCVKSASAIQ